MKSKIIIAVAAVALVALGVWQSGWDMSWFEGWIGQHRVLGAGIYFVLVVASVVLLPFSSLPLLPLATRSYGVALTALLSAAGWWAGCLIAFQIARLGRRYLERITSMARSISSSGRAVWGFPSRKCATFSTSGATRRGPALP